MERSLFDDCFLWLEKFHGKRGAVTSEARESYFLAFKDEPDEVFSQATQLACQRCVPGQFPAIERFRKFVGEAREKSHDEEKRIEGEEQRRAEYRAKKAKEAMGDIRHVPAGVEALALLKKIGEHGFTEDIIAECMRFSAAHPAWAAHDWRAARLECEQIRANIEERAARNSEPARDERPAIPVRTFADIHERSAFYRKLFSEGAAKTESR